MQGPQPSPCTSAKAISRMLSAIAFVSWLLVVMMVPPGRAKAHKMEVDDDAGSRASSSSGVASAPSRARAAASTFDLGWTQDMHEAAALGAEWSQEGRGNYTCCECKRLCFRVEFLITSVTADGELAPGHDWQGALYGTCYSCFRGRGPWKGEDGFSGKTGSEDFLMKLFAKMSKERHAMRKDVKDRDVQRLRTARYDALLEEEMQKKENKGVNKKEIRKTVVAFIKAILEDAEATYASLDPHLRARWQKVFVMYEKVKVAELNSDAIVIPGGEIIKENYQYLHRLMNDTARFFLCRSISCSDYNGGRGNFYGLNTDWIHTEDSGGGQYACPACGQQYRPGSTTTAVIKAHFAMVMMSTNSVMLSAWPAGAEENAIANFMEIAAEHEMKQSFEMYRGLPDNDLKSVIVQFVKNASVPADFTKHSLSTRVQRYIDQENTKRTNKKPWSYQHLKDGYVGTFVRVNETTPIQTEEETKEMLAAIKVHSMRHIAQIQSAL